MRLRTEEIVWMFNKNLHEHGKIQCTIIMIMYKVETISEVKKTEFWGYIFKASKQEFASATFLFKKCCLSLSTVGTNLKLKHVTDIGESYK